MQNRVPVLMFHSVGARNLDWPYSFLSEHEETFLKKIDYLLRAGYEFIFLEELYFYMRDGRKIPRKSVAITFDDGYLDNWTIVFPLLKKRGVKFTIFVSQEFVDPRPVCRPTLEDVWEGRIDRSELQILGHLSWLEMTKLIESGLVDIQSHTSTHTWHFIANTILDFYSPENARDYPWLLWNNLPETKPNWMLSNGLTETLYGLPIYPNARALVAHRYHEDPELNRILSAHVATNGGEDFFRSKDWRLELHNLALEYRKSHGEKGRFETPAERSKRLKYELHDNRITLQERLNKEVRFLCWPGGAYDKKLVSLAKEYGYWATTVKEGWNTFGGTPERIHRISSGNPAGGDRFPWKYSIFILKFYLARFKGRAWARCLDRIYRLVWGRK